MDKIKINLDRTKLSTEYIKSKQNFGQIMNQVPTKASFFKSTWFYGSIGLATVSGILFLALNMNPQKELNETKITLAKSEIAINQSERLNIQSPSNDVAPKSTSFEPIRKVKESKLLSNKDLNSEKKVVIETAITQNEGVASSQFSYVEPKFQKEKLAEVKNNRLPKIKGIYSGNLALDKLCSSSIEVSQEIQISSFKIQYETRKGERIVDVNGSKVPANICKDIEDLGIDQMIFFTEILGADESGQQLRFTPMNLTCLIEE